MGDAQLVQLIQGARRLIQQPPDGLPLPTHAFTELGLHGWIGAQLEYQIAVDGDLVQVRYSRARRIVDCLLC